MTPERELDLLRRLHLAVQSYFRCVRMGIVPFRDGGHTNLTFKAVSEQHNAAFQAMRVCIEELDEEVGR